MIKDVPSLWTKPAGPEKQSKKNASSSPPTPHSVSRQNKANIASSPIKPEKSRPSVASDVHIAPLVNEYKIPFISQRLLETCFGGLRLLRPDNVPLRALFAQLGLFITSISIALPLSIISSLSDSLWFLPFAAGGIAFIICLVLKLVAKHRLSNSFSSKKSKSNNKRGHISLEEGENFDFDAENLEEDGCFASCSSTETTRYVFSDKRRTITQILLHSILAGIATGAVCWYLSPSQTSSSLQTSSSSSTECVIYLVFGWIAASIALHALFGRPAAEPNQFRNEDDVLLSSSNMNRPFFLGLLISLESILTSSVVTSSPAIASLLSSSFSLSSVLIALRVLFACTPLLQLFGTIPSWDTLLEWAAEQFLARFLGGSIASSASILYFNFSCAILSAATVILLFHYVSQQLSVFIALSLGLFLSTGHSFGGILPYSRYLRSRSSSSIVPSILNPLNASNSPSSPPPSLSNVAIVSIVGGVGLTISGIVLHFLNIQAFANYSLLSFVIDSDYRFLPDIALAVLFVLSKASSSVQNVFFFFNSLRNPFYHDRNGKKKQIPHAMQQIQHRKGEQKESLSARIYHSAQWVSRISISAYLIAFAVYSSASSSSMFASGASSAWQGIVLTRAARRCFQATPWSLFEITAAVWIDRLVYHVASLNSSSSVTWLNLSLCVKMFILGEGLSKLYELLSKIHLYGTLLLSSISNPKMRYSGSWIVAAGHVIGLPVSLAILLLSCALSAPLLPLFGIPFFIIGFPRPVRSWPNVGSGFSPCDDSAFYQQLLPSIQQSINKWIQYGAIPFPDPASPTFLLMRHDALVLWLEIVGVGLGHVSVVVKGLELQTTSCHHVEATRLDEVLDSAFLPSNGKNARLMNENWSHTLEPLTEMKMRGYSISNVQLTGIIDHPDNLSALPNLFTRSLLWHLLAYSASSSFPSAWSKQMPSALASSHESDQTVHLSAFVAAIRPKVKSQGFDASPSASSSILQLTTSSSSKFYLPPSSSLSHPAAANNYQKQSLPPLPGQKDTPGPLPSVKVAIASAAASDVEACLKQEDQESDIDALLDGLGLRSPSPANRLPAFATSASLPPIPGKLSPSASSNLSISPQPFLGNHIKTLSMSLDDGPSSPLLRLALACCSAILPSSTKLTAHAVFQAFSGTLPATLDCEEWFQSKTCADLKNIVIEAFKWAVKLMYDRAVYGGVDYSDDELTDAMVDFQSNWHFGLSTTTEWSDAVSSECSNLFALSSNVDGNSRSATIGGRLLCLQDLSFRCGRMNSEAVRGLWASLALELLYLGSDDDERYSIQAHPVLLRNMTIHAAEPPLGYPIFNSCLHISS